MISKLWPILEAQETVNVSCSFQIRPADALLSSEPGDGQGNLAPHKVAHRTACSIPI